MLRPRPLGRAGVISWRFFGEQRQERSGELGGGGGGGSPLSTLAVLVWNRVCFSKELRERMNVFIVSIPNE